MERRDALECRLTAPANRRHCFNGDAMAKNPLITQLEDQRFLNAVGYVHANAQGLKKLIPSELAQLNQLLTAQSTEAWRSSSASITIPSGKTHQFSMLSNPTHLAREIIDAAEHSAVQGDFKDAAFQIYSRLILAHLFNDANRRTAALACLWLLHANGKDIDAVALAKESVGDMREKADQEILRKKIDSLIRL